MIELLIDFNSFSAQLFGCLPYATVNFSVLLIIFKASLHVFEKYGNSMDPYSIRTIKLVYYSALEQMNCVFIYVMVDYAITQPVRLSTTKRMNRNYFLVRR